MWCGYLQMCLHIKKRGPFFAYALCRYTLFVHIFVHKKLLYIAHLSTKKMALFVEKKLLLLLWNNAILFHIWKLKKVFFFNVRRINYDSGISPFNFCVSSLSELAFSASYLFCSLFFFTRKKTMMTSTTMPTRIPMMIGTRMLLSLPMPLDWIWKKNC